MTKEKTITRGILQKFCSKDEKREWITAPIFIPPYTYSTDGHMIIRIKDDFGYFECLENKRPLFLNLFSSFDFQEKEEWKHFDENELQMLKPKKLCNDCDPDVAKKYCVECRGEEVVSFSNDHNNYEFECASCEGEGYKPFDPSKCPICNRIVISEKIHLNFIHLALVLENLGEIEINIKNNTGRDPVHFAVPFKFIDGEGFFGSFFARQ